MRIEFKISLFVVTFVCLLGSAFAVPTPVDILQCPDVTKAETSEDCPWASVSRILATDLRTSVSTEEMIASLLPQLDRQLKIDAQLDGYKNLWGQSLNYDEYAQSEIVEPKVLDAIFREAKAPKRDDHVVHAGFEHTYGYLFSNLKTPFGYKRARWVRGELESGFGLPQATLGPNTKEGTLFSNLTYFAGKIAFRDTPSRLKALESGNTHVATALRDFKYDSLKVARLTERVSVKEGGFLKSLNPFSDSDELHVINLRTDIVAFPKNMNTHGNSHLLIYSIDDSRKSGPALITAFPVDATFVEKLSALENLGEGKTITTRYNAFVEDLTTSKQTLSGSRQWIAFK